jgi:hypothetical protein
VIEIKNRYSGAIIRTVKVENLRSADLYGANLYGADLYGADLYGADLRSANLRGADLYGANLYGADLYGADLYGANLRGANLRSADLRSADLYGADLYGADLYGADLYGADLRSANLRGANLRGADLYGANLYGADLYGADLAGVAEGLGITVDPTLPGRILAQVAEHPESWCQKSWHSACGTRHCIAGFATHLSGELGRFLDKNFGTATAATLLLWRPGVVMPSFDGDATEGETLGRLRAMAATASTKAGES